MLEKDKHDKRPRLEMTNDISKIRLTFDQAQKLILESPFKNADGTEDRFRNNELYKLLTADVGNQYRLSINENYFTVSWMHESKNPMKLTSTKIIWRKNEHVDNERTKNLILEFLKAKTFGEFQKKAKKYLGKKWKNHFKKEFDPVTSKTQRKGNIKIKKSPDKKNELKVKRMNGNYNIRMNDNFIGTVPQKVAAHIWRYPEFYFALGPINAREIWSIYNQKSGDKDDN